MDKEDLEEKAARYARLLSDDGLLKTLDELDLAMGLKQNVFGVLKTGQTSEYVLAKEGARAYSSKFRGLAEEAKSALENEKKNQGEIDE
jgi:hypothetical protein